MPLHERRCFHDFTPLIPVVSSVPGRPQPQILLFEVVRPTYGCQLTRRARVMSLARYIATVPDP